MPLRHQPPSLRKATMLVIAGHFESICYGCRSADDQRQMFSTDAYLDVEGPFVHMPQHLLEELAEETKHITHLRKHHLHLFLTPSLTKWSAHGVGDLLVAFPLLITRCQNLKRLDIPYLRHINPNILLSLVPRFTSLVSLNLCMTLAVDQMMAEVGRNCPNLLEINLTATPITDRGLVLLCVGENGERQASNLTRLVVADTFVTASGAVVALQSLPRLREFDFDQIFEALEKLEQWDVEMEMRLFHGVGVRVGAEPSLVPCSLQLSTLVSSAEQVRLEGLDAAARLCPETTTVALANAWLPSEALYKLMVFDKLTSLSLTNSEGLTLDFYEGVLPVLAVCGERLQNLILANFTSIDIAGVGRSCKKLCNLAVSNVAQYEPFGPICPDWFQKLQALELWSDPEAGLSPNIFRQLLLFAPQIQNVLFKGCEVLTDNLFIEILETNPMKKLSHVTFDHCQAISGRILHQLLDDDNDLTVIRIWNCINITKYTNTELSRRICDENMDVYLEWFEYDD